MRPANGNSHSEGGGPSAVGAPTTLMVVGIAFGLLTGLAEAAAFLTRRYVLGRFNWLGYEVIWLAPLMNVLIFGAIGLVFFVIARSRRGPPLLRAAVTTYSLLAAFTVLLLYYPLHVSAKLLLSAGIAAQAGRLAVRRPAWINVFPALVAWPSTLWRSFSWLRQGRDSSKPVGATVLTRRDFMLGTGATLGALGAGVHGPALVGEWKVSRQSANIRPDAPNVLLLVLDTVRSASMSLYGYDRETTPQLSRLARRGLFFTRAFAPAPWTLPTHASLFTGRHPHELSVDWESPLDGAYPTLAEMLSEQGYATGGFVANTQYCSYESGLHRGFQHYEDYPVNAGQFVNSSRLASEFSMLDATARRRRFEIPGRKRAVDINRHFLTWAGRQRRVPFFAFLNYYDAHAPYLPPTPFDSRFGPRSDRPNPRHSYGWEWTSEQIRAERDAYDGAISYVDHQVAALLTELDHAGRLDNTLVIVTSDHGEQFGEHGLVDHANSLYAQLLQVPLVLLWPKGIPAGMAIHQPLGLRHLAATILDLVGIKAAAIPGRSLAHLWQDATPVTQRPAEPILSEVQRGDRVPDHFRNSRGEMASIVVDHQHYIKDGDGGEELYDLDADPAETRNLAADAERAGGLHAFREMLDRLRREDAG